MFKSRRYKEYPGENIDGNDGEGEKRGWRIWDKDIAEDIETAAVNSFLSNTKTRTTWTTTLQTRHVYSTLRRRGRSSLRRFNVEHTWCVCREVAKTLPPAPSCKW